LHWMRLPGFDPDEVLREQAVAPDVRARVWIDVSDRRLARLYLADHRAQRFLVRDLPLPDGLDELGKEALAQVVESSVAALLEDASVGLTRAEATSVLTARRPPAGAAVGLAFEALVVSQAVAPELPIGVGVAVRVAAGRRLTDRTEARLWALAAVDLPQRYQSAAIGARLQAVAVRAGAAVAVALGGRTALLVAAGLGPDLTRLEPEQGTAGGAMLTGARWTSALVGRAEVGLSVALRGHARLALSAFADADLRATHYDVMLAEQRTAVIAPYRVRPGLMLGAQWR
jgi:hypothetical protein